MIAARGEVMFSALLRMRQFLMRLGIFRAIRKVPLAYSAYAFLYRYLIPRNQLFVNAHGHKIFLDHRDMGMARALLLSGGRWEETETRLFSCSVQRGMTVVDVGANVGYYTLLAARLVGDAGKVFAFEPSPENFVLLERNVKANGYENVILIPKAVSNESGTAELLIDHASSGGHKLSRAATGADSVEVETVSLDEYFANRGEQIDVLKIDAEGAEMAILQGMRDVLSRSSNLALLTEFSPQGIRDFGCLPEEYVKLLRVHGFRIYPVIEEQEKLRALDFERVDDLVSSLAKGDSTSRSLNLFCLKGNRNPAFGETNS